VFLYLLILDNIPRNINTYTARHRIRTDPRKVVEFNVEIFKALKMIVGIERSGKILENCNANLENADVYYTVDCPCIC